MSCLNSSTQSAGSCWDSFTPAKGCCQLTRKRLALDWWKTLFALAGDFWRCYFLPVPRWYRRWELPLEAVSCHPRKGQQALRLSLGQQRTRSNRCQEHVGVHTTVPKKRRQWHLQSTLPKQVSCCCFLFTLFNKSVKTFAKWPLLPQSNSFTQEIFHKNSLCARSHGDTKTVALWCHIISS